MPQTPDELKALTQWDLYLRFSKDGQTVFACGNFYASSATPTYQLSGWNLKNPINSTEAPAFQRSAELCQPEEFIGDSYISIPFSPTYVSLRDPKTDQESAHFNIDPLADGHLLDASSGGDRYLILSLTQNNGAVYLRQIRDIQTGRTIWSSSEDVLRAVSPAGDRLLLSTKDPYVSKFALFGINEKMTLQWLNIPTKLAGTLNSIEFSEDQSRLVIAGITEQEHRAYFAVWSLDQSDPITTFIDSSGGDSGSFSARFVPARNDRLLTWYRSSGSDQLWEIPSGKVLDTIYAFEGTYGPLNLEVVDYVELISISPRGDQLAGPSRIPGMIYFWDISGI